MGTNEKPPVLRSINNRHGSHVRFVNSTFHRIEILWINYEGQAVSYGTLGARDSLDISTFATHPWIFVETQTLDRLLANGKDVFYPEPWWAKYRGMPRAEIPRTMSPDLVYVTLPMYSLRDIALRTIKLLLVDDNDAYSLDIPKNLQCELATMEPRKNARNNRDGGS